ncbi:hypothetical protein F8154_05815 [Alkaliphilus pronyensis]|uniref:Uncharacterized protein n=1 Tax=Alkaliphilus pronyensis TaxID=1482732 RepID=A0A6I0F144_9FIRM|nr:hypothetical protein [Alkaliphilus pronyensis]KAB3535647.1 hypothetical protein F8154_05815 [Alkaliphilus pronyensis]
MKKLIVFVNVVEQLINKQLPGSGKLYIETKSNNYINFRPKDFRLKLQSVSGEKDINKYLAVYKKLALIITEKETFTSVQRHKNKVLRVITVDKTKYEALKELVKEGG